MMPQLTYNAQTAAALPPQMYTGYAYGALPQTGGDFAVRGVTPAYSPEVQAYLAQRAAYEAAHPELGILSGFELTAPAGRGGGELQATEAQIRQYMNTPLEQQFAQTSGNGSFAVRPDSGVRVIDHGSGETIFEGVGPDAADQAYAISQQITQDAGHNADWSVDIQNPDGTWTSGSRDLPEINKLGAFADVALPLALSLAVPGLGLVGGSLGSALGAAGGTALSGAAQGRDLGDIALSAGLSGLGAFAGGELLGSLGGSGAPSDLSNLGIDWSGIRDLAVPEIFGELGGSAAGGFGGSAAGSVGSDILVNAILPSIAPGLIGGAVGGAGGSALGSIANGFTSQPDQSEIVVNAQPPIDAVDPAGFAVGGMPGLIGSTGDLAVTPDDIVVNAPEPIKDADQLAVGAGMGAVPGGIEDIVVNAQQPIQSAPDANPLAVTGALLPDDIIVNGTEIASRPDEELAVNPMAGDIFGNPPIIVDAPKPIEGGFDNDLAAIIAGIPGLDVLPQAHPGPRIDELPNLEVPQEIPTTADLPVMHIGPTINELPNVEATPPTKGSLIDEIIKALVIGGGLTGVGGNLGGGGGTVPPGLLGGGLNPIFNNPLPPPVIPGVGDPANLGQRPMSAQDWLRYGMRPEQSFFNYVPQNYTPPAPGVADSIWDRGTR